MIVLTHAQIMHLYNGTHSAGLQHLLLQPMVLIHPQLRRQMQRLLLDEIFAVVVEG